jgi:DNA topoisomerase I
MSGNPSPALSALTTGAASDPASADATVALAGLVYVSDEAPGFSRVAHSKRFRYRDVQGRWITNKQEIRRIDQLAIPPAYTDVWICPVSNGHLQATGRDARGRKQYRYHADWREQRDESKFDRMEAFGQALQRVRARVTRDLVPFAGVLA